MKTFSESVEEALTLFIFFLFRRRLVLRHLSFSRNKTFFSFFTLTMADEPGGSSAAAAAPAGAAAPAPAPAAAPPAADDANASSSSPDATLAAASAAFAEGDAAYEVRFFFLVFLFHLNAVESCCSLCSW